MNQSIETPSSHWLLWQKIAFRFFCIFFLLQITPWSWLDSEVPGISYLNDFYYRAVEWVVERFNQYLFHFVKTTVVNNGSSDTSLNWELQFTHLCLAAAGCFVWSILDRKRESYTQANYWLRTFMRYYLIMMCFRYGIDKWYVLQMPFPNQSQLATPLGDFLPMRFSWMFIGYSTPYEMFSGAMEILAGLLLLNRKTITLGLMVGLVVLANVMVLNLCYDIPVKLFSMQLVIYFVYLLVNDIKRLLQFFVFNKNVNANTIHHISFPKKWMRVTRILLKIAFVGLFVIEPVFTTKKFYASLGTPVNTKPVRPGIYDVAVFALNKDSIPALVTDTLRWQNLVIETNGIGSVGSTDTAFRQRYRRGYFNLVVDSVKQTIAFKKNAAATNFIASFRFEMPDSNTIRLTGSKGKDSLFVLLKKSNRHFQLAERQFHWISEANR
jgi:hypothetical protein